MIRQLLWVETNEDPANNHVTKKTLTAEEIYLQVLDLRVAMLQSIGQIAEILCEDWVIKSKKSIIY